MDGGPWAPIARRRSPIVIGASALTSAIFLGWSVLLAYQPHHTRVFAATFLGAVAAFAGVRAHRLLPQLVLLIAGAALLARPLVQPGTFVDGSRVRALELGSQTHIGMLLGGAVLIIAALCATLATSDRGPGGLHGLVRTLAFVFAFLTLLGPDDYRDRVRYGNLWGYSVAALGVALAVPAALALTLDVLRAGRRSAVEARGATPGTDETS